MFLFYSNGNLPVLFGIFSGESATKTSQIDEKILVQKAMQVLHSIFNNQCPTEVSGAGMELSWE